MTPNGLRIRLGVGLVVLSWLPIAQVVIALDSLSGSQAEKVRLAIWGVQIVIGILGVAVAGRPTVDVVKRVGWRRAPRVLWGLLWRGGGADRYRNLTAVPAAAPATVNRPTEKSA
jgi:hypothetical protein